VTLMRKSGATNLGALVTALALTLTGCGDGGDDDDGGSGYTGTSVAPDQGDDPVTTPPPEDTDPGY
jgi:hypothetical protein